MSSLQHKLVRQLAARKSNVCTWIALLQAGIATTYLLLAVVERDTAEAWWFAFAVVMAVLSVWNLLVYEERQRIRKERRERRTARQHGS